MTMALDSPAVGWMALGASKGCGAEFVETTDGGRTWLEADPLPDGTVWSAALTGSGPGWSVVQPRGGAGLFLAEQPAPGQPWKPVADLGSALLGVPVSLDPTGDLWLGNLRSTDGGRTWTR